MVCLAPRALGEIVRPRRPLGRVGSAWRDSFDLSAACDISRPLNFTVRGVMSAPARPWALVAAAALAVFQAWFWFRGAFFIASAVVLTVAATLLVTAFAPRSRIGAFVSHVWAPPRHLGSVSNSRINLKNHFGHVSSLALLMILID